MPVIAGPRDGAERIDSAEGQEEGDHRLSQLHGGRVAVTGGVVHASRRDPPARLAGQLDEAGGGQRGRGHERPEDRGHHPGCQRRLVRLAGQRARLQLTGPEHRRQVIGAVADPLARDEPAGRRGGRNPGPVDVGGGNLLVVDVGGRGPGRGPDPAGPVDVAEREQVRDPGRPDRRGDAGDLGGVDGADQRGPVRVRPGRHVVDGVGVPVLGPPDVQPGLVVGQHRLGGGRQRRFRRRVARAARVTDRDAPQHVSVGVGFQGQLVTDARIGRAPLVVEGQRLARVDEEHRVQVRALGLHEADGEVLLGDRVGVGGRRGPVLGVRLDPQRVALERPVGLLRLVRAEAVGQHGVRQAHRRGRVRLAGGPQRRLGPVLAHVLLADGAGLPERAGVEPGAGEHRR